MVKTHLLHMQQSAFALNRSRKPTNLMREPKLLPGPEQRGHDCVLRVRMNAATRVAHCKCVPEQRCACRLLQVQRRTTEENAVAVWPGEREYEDVSGLNALFLHAGGRN
jgi:hypothetical protein